MRWTPDNTARVVWAFFAGLAVALVASILPLMIIFLSLFPSDCG
jgi:ABC-type uncharacterized transport system permease subunit